MKVKAIRSKRLGDSINQITVDTVRSYEDAVDSGSVAQAVVDAGLELASEKVINGLRNAGLGLDDGTVSAESIRLALSEKIGAEIPELSPEGIAQALNHRLSLEVGALLGVDGIDLIGGGDIAQQARTLALQAIASGRPSKLVSGSLLRELRQAAAYMAAGVEPSMRGAAGNRARQRRHRRTFKQVWQ